MRYLLDTNALLFWLFGSKRLGATTIAQLIDPANRVYVSSVSAFEIAVKASIGRITLPSPPARLLPPFIERSSIDVLTLTLEHSFGVYDLPALHADPFDRLLISQAVCEDLTLVTSDRQLAAYDVKTILIG